MLHLPRIEQMRADLLLYRSSRSLFLQQGSNLIEGALRDLLPGADRSPQKNDSDHGTARKRRNPILDPRILLYFFRFAGSLTFFEWRA